ncbi:hypothetical protein BC937DRAFT_90463 [Endogone sp. FLAS-F59071]|nr:hypothetical protein BC937DRAFT_90463 [Endogone sp. FLAS-F59071]|eukprot:RUS17070.1 hypothetical protein BC937DRAFT_90463 [Endogone sp. FLAS-F59071]
MIIAYKTKDGTEGQARPRKPPARDGSLVSHDANRATPSKIPKSNAAKVDHSYDYYDPSFYQYYVPSQDQPLPQPSFNLPVEHQEPPIHRLASLMAMSGVPTISLIQSPPPKASVAATPVAEIYSPQSPNTREANETNPVEQTALSIRQKITAVSKEPILAHHLRRRKKGGGYDFCVE